MKQRLVDFSDPILSAVLFILLKDRTTGKNIIWATETPPELGAGFADEITLEQIKKCPPVPRVLKRLDEQKQRTKAKAEVFTPSWVCENMIDICVNDQSEHVADFVWDERGCKEWEKKDETSADL